MKKEITLVKHDMTYSLVDSENNILITIDGKKILGIDVYDSIYAKLRFEDNEVEIIITSVLTDKEDKILLQQLVNMFKEIDNAVNLQLSQKYVIVNN